MIVFSISLSLSFSLSLSDRLRMAPKRKSTPSQNLLHSGTSSFDPTPLHIRFCDEKAHKDFSENFSKCVIYPECHMVLSDFSDTALPVLIHTRGWESLCEIPGSCPIMIIQEFYSNMHGINTSIPQFAMHIRGTHIIVTPELVFEILHVLRVSHPDYSACPRLRIVSKDEILSLYSETPSTWGEC